MRHQTRKEVNMPLSGFHRNAAMTSPAFGGHQLLLAAVPPMCPLLTTVRTTVLCSNNIFKLRGIAGANWSVASHLCLIACTNFFQGVSGDQHG